MVTESCLPDGDGLWLFRKIKNVRPKLPIIILSRRTEREAVVEALEAGAAGYLGKSARPDELSAAVRAAYAGETYLQDRLAPCLIGALQEKLRQQSLQLTQRRLEILSLLATGLSNQAIAEQLHLSLSSIKAEFRTLFQKFGVSSRTELVLEAIRRGLVRPPREEGAESKEAIQRWGGLNMRDELTQNLRGLQALQESLFQDCPNLPRAKELCLYLIREASRRLSSLNGPIEDNVNYPEDIFLKPVE